MSKEFIRLTVGDQYRLPINIHEGAIANFLVEGGSTLQILMPDLTASEEKQIRKGSVSAGIIVAQPFILLVFTFGDIVLDCPFDARLINKDTLFLPNIENKNQRLSFDVHLIDTNTNILHGLRYLTFSSELTIEFLFAVQEQLTSVKSIDEIYQKYIERSVDDLVRLANLKPCGS